MKSLKALIGGLGEESWMRRVLSAKDLAKIGPGARGALPALIAAVADEDELVRVESIAAIRMIGLSSEAIPALIRALRDESKLVAGQASGALGQASERIADEAVPALIRAMRDECDPVRMRASVALAIMGSPAVPALTVALEDENPEVREAALRALQKIEENATKSAQQTAKEQPCDS